MSTRRRNGAFVSAAVTEAARRQLMAPVPCWELQWCTPDGVGRGSTLKVYKWVRTEKSQQFSDDEDEADDALAPLPEEPDNAIDGEDEEQEDEAHKTDSQMPSRDVSEPRTNPIFDPTTANNTAPPTPKPHPLSESILAEPDPGPEPDLNSNEQITDDLQEDMVPPPLPLSLDDLQGPDESALVSLRVPEEHEHDVLVGLDEPPTKEMELPPMDMEEILPEEMDLPEEMGLPEEMDMPEVVDLAEVDLPEEMDLPEVDIPVDLEEKNTGVVVTGETAEEPTLIERAQSHTEPLTNCADESNVSILLSTPMDGSQSGLLTNPKRLYYYDEPQPFPYPVNARPESAPQINTIASSRLYQLPNPHDSDPEFPPSFRRFDSDAGSVSRHSKKRISKIFQSNPADEMDTLACSPFGLAHHNESPYDAVPLPHSVTSGPEQFHQALDDSFNLIQDYQASVMAKRDARRRENDNPRSTPSTPLHALQPTRDFPSLQSNAGMQSAKTALVRRGSKLRKKDADTPNIISKSTSNLSGHVSGKGGSVRKLSKISKEYSV